MIIEVAEGLELTSTITKKSCENLGLEVGKEAYVVIKASNVIIGVEYEDDHYRSIIYMGQEIISLKIQKIAPNTKVNHASMHKCVWPNNEFMGLLGIVLNIYNFTKAYSKP